MEDRIKAIEKWKENTQQRIDVLSDIADQMSVIIDRIQNDLETFETKQINVNKTLFELSDSHKKSLEILRDIVTEIVSVIKAL